MLVTSGQADDAVASLVSPTPAVAAVAAATAGNEKPPCVAPSGARSAAGPRERLRPWKPGRRDCAPPPASAATAKGETSAPPDRSSLLQSLVANQLRITGWVLLAVLAANALAIPGTDRFVRLLGRRTREDGSVYYVKSWDDLYLVAFHAALFVFLRSAAMAYVLVPFAQRWFARERAAAAAPAGRTAEAAPPRRDVRRRSSPSSSAKPPPAHPKSVRFAEQGWLFLYYSVYWSIGVYVMYHSPTWYYRTEMFWEGYPHLEMSALQKWYYLSQAGFWISQHWVVQTETKRKDHTEMVLHHLVTSALIISSYFLNFTRIGTAVFVMMDTSDFLLPLAKMLRYLKLQRLCDAVFLVFVVSWIYTRHYLYFIVMRSVCAESSVLATYPPHPENPFNEFGKYVFVAIFVVLQVLLQYWFFLICKVLYRVVTGKGAEDTREKPSTDEEESGDRDDAGADVTFDEEE